MLTLGFILLLIDIANSNLINIIWRFRKDREQHRFGITSLSTQTMNVASNNLQWLLRFATFAMSIIQHKVATQTY